MAPGAYRSARCSRPWLAVAGGEDGGACNGGYRATTLALMGLTERDKAILDFEQSWWCQTGVKTDAVRDCFELSSTRYDVPLTELEPRPATEWRSR